jgi:indole-3-glycerol phosphate synthase
LTRLGFDGFLIGETLMRSRDPEAALISLTGGRK